MHLIMLVLSTTKGYSVSIMAQKKSTKTTKARSTSRATTAKSRTTTRKPTAKKTVRKTTRAAASQKVDYYPNRVALLTATAAVLILLTLGLITAM
jgi:hypothetical protein